MDTLRSRSRRTADRRAEILAEALELMAEHGYHGASLRDLAKRLGISQPSLYHYFASKDELVEQIIEAYSGRMFEGTPNLLGPLEQVPGLLRDHVLRLYQDSSHPTFIRFVFAVSRINPRFGRLNREIFVDRAMAGLAVSLDELARRNAIDVEQLGHVLRAEVNAISFRLMEETVLFDARPIDDDVRRFADEVASMTAHWLLTLRERGRRAQAQLGIAAGLDAGRQPIE
ncbi:MAG TPA: helix-turn-helix domain-containing protein [Enhygromyxa sp.]|nr:helix-turn-helix domain-containing protein [Enhygromyxa sp.]